MLLKTATVLMMSTALTAGAAWAQTSTPASPASPVTPAPPSVAAPTPSTTPMTTTAPMTTPAPMTSASSTVTPAGTDAKVVTQQGMSEFRVSKFIGVDIYGSENQKIGDITEILIDSNGNAKTVVIGVGGFLGIGQKNVAVPFAGVEWKLQPMATASATPATTTAPAGSTAMGTAPATTASTGMGGAPATTASTAATTRTPAETAAYNGYPDHGVVKMSKQELQDAPTFKYVADMGTGSGATNAAPTATTAPRQ